MSKKLQNILKSQNVNFEILEKEKTSQYQQKWREIYSKLLFEETGEWVKDNMDWHTFSYGYTLSYSGNEAWNKNRESFSGECLLLPNLNEGEGFKCMSNKPINLSNKSIDAYICPLDFSWTFVTTHENGLCGPYFCEKSML